jgi:hypothetical protein
LPGRLCTIPGGPGMLLRILEIRFGRPASIFAANLVSFATFSGKRLDSNTLAQRALELMRRATTPAQALARIRLTLRLTAIQELVCGKARRSMRACSQRLPILRCGLVKTTR